MTHSKLNFSMVLVGILLMLTPGCKKSDNNSTGTTPGIDYSEASNWLSLPATVYPVDVFYLYPTAWTNNSTTPVICEINDTSMLRLAPQAYARTATVFDTLANVYAPFYRQGNLTPNAPAVTAGIPTTDGTAAFDYYIKHFNKGRPFILAGHSQGSNVLSNLLAGYLKDNPQVYSRMIAAYVIGYPVTKDYLKANPHLKFATGPDDTGVIISYNTEDVNITVTNPILWGLVGVVINPITWTRDQTLATVNQGLGSFMPDPKGKLHRVPQCADAWIDTAKGVLFTHTTYSDSLAASTHGIYHGYDYPFYYFSLRQNAANRIQHFMNK